MDKESIFKDLQTESTWKIIGLGIVTLGVYYAYYIKKQAITLNKYFEDNQISEQFILSLIVASYISAGLTFCSFFVDEKHLISSINNIFGFIPAIMIVAWAFQTRKKIHNLINPKEYGPYYLGGGLTFFFNALYINYKINEFNEKISNGEFLQIGINTE